MEDFVTPSGLSARKQALRRKALARRTAGSSPCAAQAVADRLPGVLSMASDVIAGFISIGSELDPAPALAALAEGGHALCLPFVRGPDEPLGFRRYRPGDPLIPGPYGTKEPGPEAPPVSPGIVLVPLLAFDRKGFRLGYGGGYYDRTLKVLRREGPILAVGLAYGFQEVPSVPHDAFDERLDVVVTEQGAIACAEDG